MRLLGATCAPVVSGRLGVNIRCILQLNTGEQRRLSCGRTLDATIRLSLFRRNVGRGLNAMFDPKLTLIRG